MLVATAVACVLARSARAVAPRLESTLQYFAGLLVPPLVIWLAFRYAGGMQGSRQSGAGLVVAWFACVLVGAMFARAARRERQPPTSRKP